MDRAFTLTGVGLVVTGTLVAGRIAVEDRLLLSPSGLELRVRGLHAQNRPAPAADGRPARGLEHRRPAAVEGGGGARRLGAASGAACADRAARRCGFGCWRTNRPALRADTPVHVHLAATHVMGRVAPLDRERIEPGAGALVRLTLERPIGALAGDRVVLRDAGAARTIGGGTVIDPFPPARGRRVPARLAVLQALELPDPVAALRAVLAQPPGWTERAGFMRARNLPAAAQDAMLRAVPAFGVADLAMAPAALEAVRAGVVQALAAHHAAAPDQPGLQAERLRLALPQRVPQPALRAVLELLVRGGAVQQDGPWFRLPQHRVRLLPQEERLWTETHRLLAADRFRPPRVRDLARELSVPEPAMRRLLRRLQRMGRVAEVAPDHFFPQEALAEMAGIVADLAATDPAGEVTAAVFRDRLDNGRKVAIQVLEFFDSAGLTVRRGDARTVRTGRIGMFGVGGGLPELRSRPLTSGSGVAGRARHLIDACGNPAGPVGAASIVSKGQTRNNCSGSRRTVARSSWRAFSRHDEVGTASVKSNSIIPHQALKRANRNAGITAVTQASTWPRHAPGDPEPAHLAVQDYRDGSPDASRSVSRKLAATVRTISAPATPGSSAATLRCVASHTAPPI